LAIDDDPAVRELLVRALGEAGYEVVAVPDGQSGLAAAKEAEFELLLTNSFMPGLHGTPFMAHLKQAFTNLPILHLDDVRPFRLSALLEAVALAMPDRLLASETRLSSEVLQGHMPRALSSSHGSG
jgi:CheY-like chemotaxis protein